jgi:DNA polymerase-1
MILLVDADILLFRMCFSHEKKIDWGDGVESTVTDLPLAQGRISKMVEKMRTFCHCDEVRMCLTGRRNFRYKVYPDYKANRQHQDFQMIKPLRAWMTRQYTAIQKTYLEADDVMGIVSTHAPDQYVIATIDKDLLQIPGRHYNWNSNKRVLVNEEQADLMFFQQIMTGDTTDNYFGIPGIGPVKAKKFLAETPKDEWWSGIVKMYAAKDLSEEYAFQMARVARILRAEDYDFETEGPILWTPNKSKGD